MRSIFCVAVLFALCIVGYPLRVDSFSTGSSTPATFRPRTSVVSFMAGGSDVDPNEIIARRITVRGDVNGGYVRSSIVNEASRFRRLIGTMSPPENESDTAEVYVEGKRKMVDGFIRWCEKGSKHVGLSQTLTVENVEEEEPTGLYDGFYAKTN